MQVITVLGKASQRVKLLNINRRDLNKTLLSFLTEKQVPIASSCRGLGKCGLCLFNKKELTCQRQVSEYCGKTIEIDYL